MLCARPDLKKIKLQIGLDETWVGPGKNVKFVRAAKKPSVPKQKI